MHSAAYKYYSSIEYFHQMPLCHSCLSCSGPSDAVLTNEDQAKVSVSELKQGTYVFKLTVTDASGEKSSAQVTVIVKGGKSDLIVDVFYLAPEKASWL